MPPPSRDGLEEGGALLDWLTAAVDAGRHHVLTDLRLAHPDVAMFLAVGLCATRSDYALTWLYREGPPGARYALAQLLDEDMAGDGTLRAQLRAYLDAEDPTGQFRGPPGGWPAPPDN